MDRVISYPGQVPLETDLLSTNKNAMIGLAKLAAAVLGTATMINGFATVPDSPASMKVSVGQGEIYALANIDGTAYSSLAADTTHQIVKQGIALDAQLLTLTAPVTVGQSVNYLIQIAYQDSDTGAVVLPYYNSSNPAVAYSGPANSGATQATARKGACVVSAKAGAPATTGTQTTPAPDAGYVGAYVVTVAYGQTTVTAPNISAYASAPRIAQTTQLWSQLAAIATAAGITPDIAVSTQLKSALDALYAPIGLVSGNRNRLINGNFAIKQDPTYASGAAVPVNGYIHDGWKAGGAGGTASWATTGIDTTLTITAGSFYQVVEGVFLEGGTYTLSWAGTAQAHVGAGAYAASPIVVTGVAANTNLNIEFGVGTVSTVQFEPGGSATLFERNPLELLRCQRQYYRRSETISSFGNAPFVLQQRINNPVFMRAVPTLSAAAWGYYNCSSGSVSGTTATSYMAYITSTSGSAAPCYADFIITADARL